MVDERASTDPARPAVAFVRALRAAGIDVPPDSTITYAQAIAELGAGTPHALYWAGRTTLVHRPEDIATYDATFTAFWGGGLTVPTPQVPPQSVTLAVDDPDADTDGGEDTVGGGPQLTVRFSRWEVLSDKDFAAYTDDELDEAHRLMSTLSLAGARRPSRRPRPAPDRRGRHDLRRTVRAALRTGGEPVRQKTTRSTDRPRRVVLLVDVSGSMEPYARALLRFVHAAVVARGRVEAFALGTRLTRLTRELSTHDPDEALRGAAGAVVDMAGGTRLGPGLRAFNDEWGQRGMARGAVVVILSDGWDRGDPDELAEQMQRLGRVAHRLVWVNPLKATPGYEPLARGMAAALPFVDEFVEGHSLRSLADLAALVASLGNRNQGSRAS